MDIDLSDAVLEYAQPTRLITVTKTTVDFEDKLTELATTINATIQPANKEKLKVANVDYALQYLMVHSDWTMLIGQYIEHKAVKFKIISINDYQHYGYTEAIAEEVKGAIT